jgi:putative ABC transport system substrate-binding protein
MLLRLAMCLSAIAGTALADAQPATQVPRIGFLSALSYEAFPSRIDAFRQGLKELGYIDGRNIVVEYRWAEGKSDRLPQLAAELERLKVRLIVSAGPSATRPAKQATTTTPIVMAFDSDPVGSGFVVSLGRPGGRITGLSRLSPEISAKQIDVLTQIVPRLSRVAILGDFREPGNASALEQTEHAARILGVQVHQFDVRVSKNIEEIIQSARKERADALVVLPSVVTYARRTEVIAFASKHRLPAMYAFEEFVDVGGLITYSANMDDLFRRAATYVDRILKGSKPAELPVEQPSKFDFVINLKAAKQIGLEIPMSVLARADRVIQ